MDLATRKYNFIKELTKIDEVVFDKLEKVLKQNLEKNDWSNDLLEEEIVEIEKGIKDADNGNLIDHDVVMKKFSKWH